MSQAHTKSVSNFSHTSLGPYPDSNCHEKHSTVKWCDHD